MAQFVLATVYAELGGQALYALSFTSQCYKVCIDISRYVRTYILQESSLQCATGFVCGCMPLLILAQHVLCVTSIDVQRKEPQFKPASSS